MSCNTILHAVIFSYCLKQHVFGAPNIIFILTDDQDLTLDSMKAMPNVISEIANKGLTFTNAFANTPVCCPSRTETVSGRTYHNVKQDKTDCQGVSASYNVYQNENALFNKFHDNGYITGSFGKLTNDMDFCVNAPDLSSFDRLHVSCNYRDFFTSSNFNKYVGEATGGEQVPTLFNPEDIYQTAQLGNATVDFIMEQLNAQQTDSSTLPFIIWVAPYAPHSPADPAPWHQDRFDSIQLLRTPNYNSDDVSQYHLPLSQNPKLDAEAEEFMLLLYKDRLRSLLAVDDMVLSIVDAVDQYNAWDNTYLVYTSDHGYHIGQYRLPCEKYQPYEETVRIPLYVRGGNVQQGTTDAMIQNIDFLPTFLNLADITYDEDNYDGRSFQAILNDTATKWRQTIMFEYHTIKGGTKSAGFNSCAMWKKVIDSNHPFGQTATGIPDLWVLDNTYNNWRVLRIKNESVNWFYGEFLNEAWDVDNPIFFEFYDLEKDPFQQTNSYLARDLLYLTDDLLTDLHDLVMSYGECCGADSCSPLGNDRPAQPAADSCVGSSSGGGGNGGGGEGRGKSNSANMEDIVGVDNYQTISDASDSFNGKEIAFILWGAAILGLISFVVGIFIGMQLQKQKSQAIMDKPMIIPTKL